MKLTIQQKLAKARALFEKATGVPPSPEWRASSERDLDVLIWLFTGMVNNDPRVLCILAEAMELNRARSGGTHPVSDSDGSITSPLRALLQKARGQ